MSESDGVNSKVNQGFSPLPAIKAIVIAVALIFAYKMFAAAVVTDTVQTLINGKPLPKPPAVDQVDYAEQIIKDHRPFPPQSVPTVPSQRPE